MAGREYSVSSAGVLAHVAASSMSAYDCEFVALAADLDVALVTADRKLLMAFPRIAVHLTAFGS